MKKISIGNVFEIQTSKGKAYFQFVYIDKSLGELIRVFPGLFIQKPSDLDKIVERKETFVLFFPVQAAKNRKLIRYVGEFNVPVNFLKPTYMISSNIVRGKFLGWIIHEIESWKMNFVTELSKEQRGLSQWGTWNDTLLSERLAEEWTPSKDIDRLIAKYGDPKDVS